jgi:hypothetical protein
VDPLTLQLIAGIIALWGVLSAFVAAGFRFLLDDRKSLKEELAKERADADAKLDGAGQVILRQNDSMQKQLDSQAVLLAQQQTMIDTLQVLARKP